MIGSIRVKKDGSLRVKHGGRKVVVAPGHSISVARVEEGGLVSFHVTDGVVEGLAPGQRVKARAPGGQFVLLGNGDEVPRRGARSDSDRRVEEMRARARDTVDTLVAKGRSFRDQMEAVRRGHERTWSRAGASSGDATFLKGGSVIVFSPSGKCVLTSASGRTSTSWPDGRYEVVHASGRTETLGAETEVDGERTFCVRQPSSETFERRGDGTLAWSKPDGSRTEVGPDGRFTHRGVGASTRVGSGPTVAQSVGVLWGDMVGIDASTTVISGGGGRSVRRSRGGGMVGLDESTTIYTGRM